MTAVEFAMRAVEAWPVQIVTELKFQIDHLESKKSNNGNLRVLSYLGFEMLVRIVYPACQGTLRFPSHHHAGQDVWMFSRPRRMFSKGDASMKRHLAKLVLSGILGTMALAGNAQACCFFSFCSPCAPTYCAPVTYCAPTYYYCPPTYCSFSFCATTPATTAAPATVYAAAPATYTYPVAYYAAPAASYPVAQAQVAPRR